VLRALEEPLRQIVNNAGDDPGVVLNKVVEGKANFGFNAQTGEYGDLVEMGVVDPTKVARFALQNAASVASLLLTTEAMVAELPKDEKGMGGGGGGGMGGMGGMGDMAGHHGPGRPCDSIAPKQAPLRRGFVLWCRFAQVYGVALPLDNALDYPRQTMARKINRLMQRSSSYPTSVRARAGAARPGL
jgi:hypothetical protein